jgi:hypothetical protein
MNNEQTTVEIYIAALNAALDSRQAYETSKSCADSMTANIAALRKSVTHSDIATVLLTANVDAEFINRSERSNNRYNIYAAQKVDNAARAVKNVATLNHYTLACLRVAIAFEADASKLTHKDAVSACSASVKHSDAKREKIIKSLRYASHVAANTASTQASSSINALQSLNILSETRDASNVICYSVNRDSAALIALCARYEISLAVAA